MLLRKALADSARRALRAGGFRAVTRTIRGAPVRIPVAMGKLESLLFNPAYCPFFNEDDVMDVLAAKIHPDDVVFDVGAYHGVWAVLLARYAREVVAFEPCAGTFGVLEETIAVNNARNVAAYPIAIANEPCTADFWGTGSGASLRQGDPRRLQSRVIVDTLDNFVQARTSLPDVIKIDVEGAEHQVLSGAGRCLAHARVVCIEVHFSELKKFGADYSMIQTLLADAGFSEIMRSTPLRLGTEDPSRMHIVVERKLESRRAG